MLSNISAVNTKVFQEMRLIDEKHLNEIKDKKSFDIQTIDQANFSLYPNYRSVENNVSYIL